jgi:hypothetical protein
MCPTARSATPIRTSAPPTADRGPAVSWLVSGSDPEFVLLPEPVLPGQSSRTARCCRYRPSDTRPRLDRRHGRATRHAHRGLIRRRRGRAARLFGRAGHAAVLVVLVVLGRRGRTAMFGRRGRVMRPSRGRHAAVLGRRGGVVLLLRRGRIRRRRGICRRRRTRASRGGARFKLLAFNRTGRRNRPTTQRATVSTHGRQRRDSEQVGVPV